jgi:hypothetical protein
LQKTYAKLKKQYIISLLYGEIMNKTFLFLDDDAFHSEGIRNPEKYYPLIGADKILTLMQNYQVIKCITVESAQQYINENGCPNFISFDNDLKMKLEGIHLAQWLVEQDMDQPSFFPEDFQFFVHSQNNIAKERIYSYLGQYLQNKTIDVKKLKM